MTKSPATTARRTRRGDATATDSTSELTDSLTAATTVVLDTSVVMADPKAHLGYGNADVVVPLTVVDELDRNKVRPDAPGRNARTFLRTIEDLRIAHGGDISTAVPLPNGGTLRIEPNGLRLDELAAHHLDPSVADHRILAAALGLSGDGRPDVKVVSNDAALRIKAALLGLTAIEHTPGRVGIHAPHRIGYHFIAADYPSIAAAETRRTLDIASLPVEVQGELTDVLDNEFVIFEGTTFCFRRVGSELRPLDRQVSAWGLTPRNKEQAFALDLCLDPDVQLVALRGHAGTGKTILAIAAALHQVVETREYDRVMILRSMIAVGRQDLGFLPGDVAEKTAPWFAAVVDALVALSSTRQTYKECETMLAGLVDSGQVALEPMTFLRGRSLTRTVILMDEAQNIETSEAKTIISRLGRGSKLIMTGDDGQVDASYISATTCGLNVTVDAFAGVDLFGQVFFSKGERSRLADLAAERL